jgi:hypothetical protein
MIKQGYKTFLSELECPNCDSLCEDEQKESNEDYKEEYCGNCDKQFGYEEKFEYSDNLDDWQGEQFKQDKKVYYWAYKI